MFTAQQHYTHTHTREHTHTISHGLNCLRVGVFGNLFFVEATDGGRGVGAAGQLIHVRVESVS